MGAQSSIYKTWDIEYFYESHGYTDDQIEEWKVNFRYFSWIGPLVIVVLLWMGNMASHFVRDSRRTAVIHHLHERDRALNSFSWRKSPTELERKDTSLSSATTLVEQEDDGPPSKPLPPLPSAAVQGSRMRSQSDAHRRSIAFNPDMPYTEESLARPILGDRSLSDLSARPRQTHVQSAITSPLCIKKDTSRLDTIIRPPLKTAVAIGQAYSRTWLTWKRCEVFGVSIDVNETAWTVSYFGCMMLLGFLYTPGHSRFLDTNVTIHRCSSLAVAQLPLIIGLASKNNTISYLTGISYERLNFLHRNAARVFYLFSLYHFGGHVYCGMTGLHDWNQAYVACGMIAFICFTLITVVSSRPIRTRCYEFFLVSHVVLVSVGIITLLLHRLEYWPYFAAGFTLWSFDRLVRLFRLVVLNNFWKVFRGTVLEDNTATVEEMSNGALLRVTMKRQHNWKAGKHAFVMMPTVSRFPWEAHPFTIALMHHVDEARSRELVFLVGVQSGFTKRLLDRVQWAGGILDIPCLVEAPYGTTDDLSAYDEVVLCAGGAGGSYSLNRLMELCAKRIDQQTCVQRVHFVWSIRGSDNLDWIAPMLAEALRSTPPGFIQFHIYITRPSSREKNSKGGGLDTPFGRAASGRPDWEQLLGLTIANCSGNLAVHSCGPGAMSTSIAKALAKVYSPSTVSMGGASVDFHAETFGM